MRTLNIAEINEVSGGEWQLGFDLVFVEGDIKGEETVQDIAAGVAQVYGGAVDTMADFFTWWDPAGFYSSCGGGGGR